MKSMRNLLFVAFVLAAVASCGGVTVGDSEPAAVSPAAPESAVKEGPVPAIDSSIERAITYLVSAQNNDDGSYGVNTTENGTQKYIGDVGITGLVVAAIAQSPFAEREASKEYFQKAVKYLLDNVQPNGAISNAGKGLDNYRTSIAIMALQAVDAKKYADTIKKAQDFIKSIQFTAASEKLSSKDNPAYEGGIGYGGSFVRPDLSNTQMAIEALRESGVDASDETIKGAIKFLQRCQNLTGSNDYDQTQADVAPLNDGGARYSPYESKVTVKTTEGKKSFPSYGSMTYAFLKSMIYAGVDRTDPRVRAAYHWILVNYDLDRNPGFTTETDKNADQQGLYYYYHTMSKALLIFGDHVLKTPDGKLHNWGLELSQKLISRQDKDGAWVNNFEERWFEGNPQLVTAYSIAVLDNCRKELANQDEYINKTPDKIAELEEVIKHAREEMADGDMTKEQGEKEIADTQQAIDSLKQGLKDLQETRGITEPGDKQP